MTITEQLTLATDKVAHWNSKRDHALAMLTKWQGRLSALQSKGKPQPTAKKLPKVNLVTGSEHLVPPAAITTGGDQAGRCGSTGLGEAADGGSPRSGFRPPLAQPAGHHDALTVIQRDSSEARNTATFAVSSGWPSRPSGVSAVNFFSKSVPMTPVACGLDAAGCDRVHADIARAELGGKHACHCIQRALPRSIFYEGKGHAHVGQ